MYDEARIPAVEMLVHPHGGLHLLQQSAVCTLAFGVHGGTNIVQHAHDTRGVLQGDKRELTSVLTGGLGSRQSQTYHFIFNEITHNLVVEVLNGSPLDALLNILFLNGRTENKATFGITGRLNQRVRTNKWTRGKIFTCSAFRVSSIKICCNFSLTKFIQNCSKPFLCRGKVTKSDSD